MHPPAAAGLVRGEQTSVDNTGLVMIACKGAPTQLAMFRNGPVLWTKRASLVLGNALPADAAREATYLPQQRLIVGSDQPRPDSSGVEDLRRRCRRRSATMGQARHRAVLR